MRLTNYMREAFVRAAMNDVPWIDYIQQMRDVVQADLVEQMTPKQRAVYDDEEIRSFLEEEWVYTPPGAPSCHVYAFGRTITTKAIGLLQDLITLNNEQAEIHGELRNTLTGVAKSVGSTDAPIKALPEFEKYLPAEPAKCTTLPALANVVTSFMQAGWPKDKVKEAETA